MILPGRSLIDKCEVTDIKLAPVLGYGLLNYPTGCFGTFQTKCLFVKMKPDIILGAVLQVKFSISLLPIR